MNVVGCGAFASAGSEVQSYLDGLLRDLSGLETGAMADYIPELAKANPAHFGIALTMTDGRSYRVGDWDRLATIQSVSKPLMYAQALERYGRDHVLTKVGVEPTGERFNSIILDEENNRPFNPMVNAGAIATAALLTGATPRDGAAAMMDLFSRLAGRRLELDEKVFRSEHETGHRNRAIAWMMLNSAMIEPDPDLVLDLYFRQCSVLVNCADLSVMAATLATQGVNPVTGDRIFSPRVVRDVLSVMTTCGMYDYDGQWLFDVGFPAKSGVAGMIMGVVPGQFGVAIYSPNLDAVGNSVRGIEVCRRLGRDFGLHALTTTLDPGAAIRRTYTARDVPSNRQRASAERAALQTLGAKCAVIEAQGQLYFASAERLGHAFASARRDADLVIIDFRRVDGIDEAAMALLERLALTADGSQAQVHFTELDATPHGRQLKDCIAAQDGASSALLHPETETAIESFEDAALARAGIAGTAEAFRFADLEIFAGLEPQDIALLENAATTFAYAPGDRIITAGDEASAFYIVARGTVSITVPTGEGRTRRVSSVGPGQAFGEMAMVDGGRRSANAVANGKVLCHAFAIGRLRELSLTRPQILSAILANHARNLSDRLRAANDLIRTYQ